jgi:hypothetical protein
MFPALKVYLSVYKQLPHRGHLMRQPLVQKSPAVQQQLTTAHSTPHGKSQLVNYVEWQGKGLQSQLKPEERPYNTNGVFPPFLGLGR